jgi:hypothetical protein
LNSFLVQHGSGHCAEYLHITAPLHRAYAKQFDFEFVANFEKVDPAPFSANSEGQVWFANFLNELPENAFVGYADADVIIKKKEDLRNGLMAGCEFAILGSGVWGWLNGGVIFLRNTQAVRNFYKEVLKFIDPLCNQTDMSLNKLLPASGLKYAFFSHKWNYFPTYGGGIRGCTIDCTEEEAVIRAWHGFDAKTVVTELNKTIKGMAA